MESPEVINNNSVNDETPYTFQSQFHTAHVVETKNDNTSNTSTNTNTINSIINNETSEKINIIDESAAEDLSPSSQSTSFDQQIPGRLILAHYQLILAIFNHSYLFSQSFNSDLQLRRRLYSLGFTTDNTTARLPQLFYQQSHSLHLILQCQFRLYIEGNNDRKHNNGNSIINSSQLTSNNDLNLNIDLEYDQYVCEAELYLIKVCIQQIDLYIDKTIAGQLVALETFEVLIIFIIESYTELPQQLFFKQL